MPKCKHEKCPVRLRSRAKAAHQQLMVHLAGVSRKVECESGTQVPLSPASVHGCALLAPPHLHISTFGIPTGVLAKRMLKFYTIS